MSRRDRSSEVTRARTRNNYFSTESTRSAHQAGKNLNRFIDVLINTDKRDAGTRVQVINGNFVGWNDAVPTNVHENETKK